jgi:hypothetical protein
MNYYVLLIFAPLLILTGVLGFLIPRDKALTSGAPVYNIFHIVFGSIGLGFVLLKSDVLIRTFNIGFGLIDLYQLAANQLDLFPKAHFQWKKADDLLHLVIGLALVIFGLFY